MMPSSPSFSPSSPSPLLPFQRNDIDDHGARPFCGLKLTNKQWLHVLGIIAITAAVAVGCAFTGVPLLVGAVAAVITAISLIALALLNWKKQKAKAPIPEDVSITLGNGLQSSFRVIIDDLPANDPPITSFSQKT